MFTMGKLLNLYCIYKLCISRYNYSGECCHLLENTILNKMFNFLDIVWQSKWDFKLSLDWIGNVIFNGYIRYEYMTNCPIINNTIINIINNTINKNRFFLDYVLKFNPVKPQFASTPYF